MPITGFVLLILMLPPLVFLQRLLHREVQAILLMLTRSPKWTMFAFAFLFFPGVLLHETSHYIAAKLLRVRTGKFSLFPAQLPGGKLRMGYVETASSDFFRDSLIGAAPLITGSLVIAYAGVNRLWAHVLWERLLAFDFPLFLMGLAVFPTMPNFYLWAYIIFAVSTTMMPSEADRHAWLPLGVWVGMLLVLAIFAGAGEWMLTHLAPLLDSLLRSASMLFGLSAAFHLVLLIPLFILRHLVSKATGLRVK